MGVESKKCAVRFNIIDGNIGTDYSHGFGGKFGVQDDRKDKSAVGWDYVESPQKHESQVDHKVVSALNSWCHFFFFYFVT